MKKITFFLILLLSVVSCTNYYTVLLTEDTNIYGNSNNENIVTTIPKDTQVYVSNKANRKNYKKIKWGNYYGWAYNPSYTSYSSYTSAKSYNTSTPSYNYTPSKISGGAVHVKGYTRKDGTYVTPHTRSSPRRK
ncbi:hypothetical protein A0O34_21430 [Chryseobacterium glaciei]|uniref:Lipoprotein n=1 Tax=Chryseobacterium glaciei TaxID=1685010 RepID=A0A172Y134_9FLAO|nr:hypothetical protein [Chryseobacterium glaciei]ANF52924.1 hypothetical protein A0O34_21430 [Chryseobacterium glaciei]